MLKNIDLFSPDFNINCSSISAFADVYEIFRHNNITKAYVYAIAYKSSPFLYSFLKIGMSHPDLGEDRKYQVGERVVRQLSHVPIWTTEPISDHGNDFYRGIKRLIQEKKLSSLFNKNDLVVGVWDISKRIGLSSDDPIIEIDNTRWAEAKLCDQHKSVYKKLPSLNYQDPSNSKVYKSGFIPRSVADQFSGLFD